MRNLQYRVRCLGRKRDLKNEDKDGDGDDDNGGEYDDDGGGDDDVGMEGTKMLGDDSRKREETCTEYLPYYRLGSALEVFRALSY